MNRPDKILILSLTIAAIVTAGAMVESFRAVVNTENAEVKVDIDKTRRELERYGLKPREAMYWREL